MGCATPVSPQVKPSIRVNRRKVELSTQCAHVLTCPKTLNLIVKLRGQGQQGSTKRLP